MSHIKMIKINRKQIDIDKLNPYKTEDNPLWSYCYFMDIKNQGRTTYLDKNNKKQKIQPIINRLEKLINREYIWVEKFNKKKPVLVRIKK